MMDETQSANHVVARAEGDYGRVRRRAWWRDAVARLVGRQNQLLSYEAVKQSLKLGGPIYRGVKTVAVAQIIGSVDRYRDFDNVFLPKQDSTAGRWKSIARAFYSDVDLPPVRLYKVGDAYFVVDGHHRVSVAREQGIDFIDAEVQEVISRVPVSADLKSEDLIILHEYRRFLGRTKLDTIRPDQHIRFTVAGGYQQIIEHIAMHRYYMQLEQQSEVSEAEAVADWYDQVYLPTVEIIRSHKVLDEFPGPHRIGSVSVDRRASVFFARERTRHFAGRRRRRLCGAVQRKIDQETGARFQAGVCGQRRSAAGNREGRAGARAIHGRDAAGRTAAGAQSSCARPIWITPSCAITSRSTAITWGLI